jgi:hypothetical protein
MLVPIAALALAAAAVAWLRTRPVAMPTSHSEAHHSESPYAAPEAESSDAIERAPAVEVRSPVVPPTVTDPVTSPAQIEAPPPATTEPVRRRPAPAPARAAPDATPRAEGTLADELALLGPADAALRDGRAAAALALYDRHAVRFPDSALAEERAAGRVMALCALGRADARRQLRAFEAKYPRSPLLARLDRACGDAQ